MKDREDRFNKIYDDYKDGVFKFILSRTADIDLSKDIFQEVFMKIYEKIEKLQDNRNVKSYIFTMAKNKVFDFYRKHKETEELVNNSTVSQDTSNINKIDLSDAVKSLTGREKDVFEMKYYFNYKIKEISALLKISEGTVKRYLFDAVSKIKEKLK